MKKLLIITLLALSFSVIGQTIEYNGTLTVETEFEVNTMVIATQFYDIDWGWVGYSIDIFEYPQGEKVKYKIHLGFFPAKIFLMYWIKGEQFIEIKTFEQYENTRRNITQAR